MVDLGLSPADFWAMTPRQIRFLAERYAAMRREQWGPFAMLASLYANAHRDPNKRREPFASSDFMPADSQITETPKADADIWYALKMWTFAQPNTEIISKKNATGT